MKTNSLVPPMHLTGLVTGGVFMLTTLRVILNVRKSPFWLGNGFNRDTDFA